MVRLERSGLDAQAFNGKDVFTVQESEFKMTEIQRRIKYHKSVEISNFYRKDPGTSSIKQTHELNNEKLKLLGLNLELCIYVIMN